MKAAKLLPYLVGGLLTSLTLTAVVAANADDFDPHPLPNDLVLPLPNGARMVFRPVFLGIGDDPLATKTFEMGDRTGANYKEILRPAKLGGHFVASDAGRKDWLLYFGKYEVTRSQYEAVRGATGVKVGGTPEPRLPKTNLTRREIEDFVDALNTWLAKNAPDNLPKNSGSPGWLRLPTEEEWEFAARGGIAVNAERFAATTPYLGDLAKYEWFSGPRSSHGKLKEVGLLEPNPLGIFDLLGNAAEMTNTLYQLDGRTGGYTIRGGSFRTASDDLRASQRTEQPQYTRDRQPARDETIGFRLVLASQVITDENRAQLAASAQSKPTQRAGGEEKESNQPFDAHGARTVMEAKVQATEEATKAERKIQELQEELAKLKSVKTTPLRSDLNDVRANAADDAHAREAVELDQRRAALAGKGLDSDGLENQVAALRADVERLKERNRQLRQTAPAPPIEVAKLEMPKVPEVKVEATRGEPYVNGLGMKFVPAGTKGVLFGIWETRWKDFRAFVSATGYDAIANTANGVAAYTLEKEGKGVKWKQAGGSWVDARFPAGHAQDENHPVVCVSYVDAEAFCEWLTKKERDGGRLPVGWRYRMPTDGEWSEACGPTEYPWGEKFPPGNRDGNYSGVEAMVGEYAGFSDELVEAGRNDRWARTAPVGSFVANRYGLYDMGGNVWEWCSSWYVSTMNDAATLAAVPSLKNDGGGKTARVVRGGSWLNNARVFLRSAVRYSDDPRIRYDDLGFRVVLVGGGG